MASFFKNLFQKDDDSQPVPAAPLTNGSPSPARPQVFQENGEAARPHLPSGRTGPAHSANGPFSAASARHMTAREIAALLPPALLRFDGINPDQPVVLPMESLRESMVAGRPVLRLSQIQAACPELFQRAPLPAEDSEITLPLARVKGMLEFPIPMNPFSSSADDAPPPPASPAPPAAATNPFASINSPSPFSSASPFAAASPFAGPPVAGGTGAGSPFARSGVSLPSAAPSSVRNDSPSPFPMPVAPAVASPAAPAPLSGAPTSPFAVAASAASASPFVVVSPGPQASKGFPFPPVAPAAPPSGQTASPFSPIPVTRQDEPQAASLPPLAAAAGPAALLPSPFAPLAAPAGPAALSPFSPLPSSQGAPAPAPLSWPPPATQEQDVAALPLQPRPLAMPGARSAPVALPLPAAMMEAPASLPAFSPPAIPPSEVAPVVPFPAAPASVSEFKSTSQPVPAATVELSLRAVLRDVDPAELGFVPENVPESVRVSLPLAMLSRHLATGRVEVGLEDICAGIAEKFRPAFARAREGLRITIPMSEVFHNLPDSARPALEPALPHEAHRAITTRPFQTPFAIKAEEDSNRQLLDLAAAGFTPSSLAARPATLPVPEVVLPPAPLPLVQQASAGAPPLVKGELPVLRPAASAPAVPSGGGMAPSPLTPRLGLLSRPPGSATAPTEAPVMLKSPPRLKTVPDSPTALRAFPKPSPPPSADANHGAVPILLVPPTTPALTPLTPLSNPFPDPGAGLPPALPAQSHSGLSFPQSFPASLDLEASPSAPSADASDDLGQSFSAATLSAEPPPRAGSAPVPQIPSAVSPPAMTPIVAAENVPPAPWGPPAGSGLGEGVSSGMTHSMPALEVPEFTIPAWPAAPVPVAGLAPAPPPTPWTPAPPAPEPMAVSDPLPPVASVPLAPAPVPVVGLLPASRPIPWTPLAQISAPVAMPVPVPVAPVRLAPAPVTSPLEDLTFGCDPDLRQLMLRAVLGAEQILTPQDIVDRCAALSGLKACVLLLPHVTLTSQGMDAGEADAFRASAAKTRDSLATLAETMGLGSSGNFTLRTDHGIRSFFREADLCLAVWHAQPQFSGGTREKLILITQELAKFPVS